MASANSNVDWWQISDEQHRETYEARTQLLPELPIIGRFHLLQAVPGGLRSDAHPDEYELHVVQEGCLEMWVDSPDRRYTVTGGLAILTQPGQTHGGVHEVLNRGRWYMLRFVVRPNSKKTPTGLTSAQSEQVRNLLDAMDPPVFSFSPSLEKCFERLLDEHRHPTITSELMARSLLHELILWVARDHAASMLNPPRRLPRYSPPIQAAVAWLDEHVSEPVIMEHAADAAGLSESHFRRWFQREVGFNPSEYMMYRRIEIAKDQLRNSHVSVTKIAMDLG
ncbi:MAG TPA: AraC family transcriptional regulator, partial [Tepidisphaeraceae bacterium]|nr:AraC family transcriptional regulator [Tepidisphaeraceae bacterium]